MKILEINVPSQWYEDEWRKIPQPRLHADILDFEDVAREWVQQNYSSLDSIDEIEILVRIENQPETMHKILVWTEPNIEFHANVVREEK